MRSGGDKEMLVSALVNGHREGRLLWHALKSVHAAAEVASSNRANVEVEVVLVLDRPDDLMLEVSREMRSLISTTVVADVGDLGCARNVGIENATGDVLAILDVDDFWGSSWLRDGLLHLDAHGPAVLHPQVSQYFGSEVSGWHSPCMSDPGFPVATLLGNNVWTSAAMAPIEIFRAVPYRARPSAGRFGYEDWSWNCDTIAAGYSHYIVPNTVHFIRRRETSLSRMMMRANCLPIPHDLTLERGAGDRRTADRKSAREPLVVVDHVDQVDPTLASLPSLFDPVWYVSQPGVVLGAGESALDHFLSVGRQVNLAPGPWLDPVWYLEQNPDVSAAGWSAFDHYVLHGASEWRRPHPDFDVGVYARWKSLDAGEPLSVISHWVEAGGPDGRRWLLEALGLFDVSWLRRVHGWVELSDDECVDRVFSEAVPQPGPLFDPVWYVSQPGVVLGAGESALDHFLSVGRQANLAPGPWLDPVWYLEQNPDVPASGSAFDHYVLHGASEARRPHPDFDVGVYARWKSLDAGEPLSVISHWVEAGGPDGRRWLLEALGLFDVSWLRRVHGWVELSDDECVDRVFSEAVPQPGPLFDPVWYVSQPGVVLGAGESALDHFLSVGRQANLAPGPWLVPVWYLEQNPDLPASGSAFDHYVLHGASEWRRPHPDFDVGVYARWKSLDAGEPLSVVSHWVEAGGPDGRRWLLEALGLFDVSWLRRVHGWVELSDDECVDRVFSEAVPQPGPLFDPVWYVSQPGVVLGAGESALDHFLSVGRQANLAPGPWLVPVWYLEQNPDLPASGSAFDHYVLHGASEWRRPHPDFDVGVYARWKSLDAGEPLSVVSHWVEAGGPDGRRWLLEGLGLFDVSWLRRVHGWVELSDDECVDRVFSEAVPQPGPLFDPVWYVSQPGVVLGAGESALDHFLSVGRQANLAPGPWLDPVWYLEQNPDVSASGWSAFDHYRMRGEGSGLPPSASFVPRLGAGVVPYRRVPLELTRSAWTAGGTELGQRSSDPSWLKAALNEAKETDARLGAISSESVAACVGEVFVGSEAVQSALPLLASLRSVEILFLLPDLGVGGAIREAANVARAASEALPRGSVAVVTTDGGPVSVRHWFPESVERLALQHELGPTLAYEDAALVVANLVAAVRPRCVINVNSRAGWLVYRDYGESLALFTKLRALLFCRDYTDEGTSGGYADEFLLDTIDVLDRVAVDNRGIRGTADGRLLHARG